jgi:hypothetical protein
MSSRSEDVRGLADIVRLRTGECRSAAETIPQIAAREPGVDQRAAAHVAECLRCQAEVAAYRRLLRHLRSMRHEGVVPPVGSLSAVLAALEVAAGEQSVHSTTWAIRAACVGGITVATAAAGAAGVLVWMNRRRTGWAPTG